MPYPGDIPFPTGTPGGNASPGRPKSVGKPIVLKQPETPTGFEFSSGDPESMKAVHEQFMKNGELPPALKPQNVRFDPIEQMRRRSISKGWNDPRGPT